MREPLTPSTSCQLLFKFTFLRISRDLLPGSLPPQWLACSRPASRLSSSLTISCVRGPATKVQSQRQYCGECTLRQPARDAYIEWRSSSLKCMEPEASLWKTSFELYSSDRRETWKLYQIWQQSYLHGIINNYPDAKKRNKTLSELFLQVQTIMLEERLNYFPIYSMESNNYKICEEKI